MNVKKALIRGLLGIPIGVFISTTIGLFISLIKGELVVIPEFDPGISALTAYAIQYIISMLIGFAFAFSSAIFEIDEWSITKQTIVHLLITSIVFLPCSILARWIEPNIIAIIIYFVTFIVIYALVWGLQYVFWKSRIKKMNEKLKSR